MWSRSIADDRGVAETFVALKPRATSSGYGDLIELAATAASGNQGRKDEGSARPMAHFTVRGTQNLLMEILMAGWDKEAPMSADWTKRGRGHRGGVVRSC